MLSPVDLVELWFPPRPPYLCGEPLREIGKIEVEEFFVRNSLGKTLVGATNSVRRGALRGTVDVCVWAYMLIVHILCSSQHILHFACMFDWEIVWLSPILGLFEKSAGGSIRSPRDGSDAYRTTWCTILVKGGIKQGSI